MWGVLLAAASALGSGWLRPWELGRRSDVAQTPGTALALVAASAPGPPRARSNVLRIAKQRRWFSHVEKIETLIYLFVLQVAYSVPWGHPPTHSN